MKQYLNLQDLLQILGVETVQATRFICGLREAPEQTFLEVYGQGRIVEEAHKHRCDLNLRGLDALDLRTLRPDGTHWDFRLKQNREDAEAMVRRLKPRWLIGSPPCVSFSKLKRTLNYWRMDASKVRAIKKEGRQHLRLMMRLYHIQLDHKCYFLHEHPESASSWAEPCVQELLARDDASVATADQGQYGLKAKGADGEQWPAVRPTTFMSNSPAMIKRLQDRCPRTHTHQPLLDGRARNAQLYPAELILEILRGMRDQADDDMLPAEEEADMHRVSLLHAGFTDEQACTYSPLFCLPICLTRRSHSITRCHD